MTIVRSTYRYKRPPRKRKAVALDVPAIVRAGKKVPAADTPETLVGFQHDKSAIVTIKRKPGRFGDAPDLTPEEINRRRDAADALWRELIRRVHEQ